MKEPTIKTTAHVELNDLGDEAYSHMIEVCGPTGSTSVEPDKFDLAEPFWTALVSHGYPPSWFQERGVERIIIHAEY